MKCGNQSSNKEDALWSYSTIEFYFKLSNKNYQIPFYLMTNFVIELNILLQGSVDQYSRNIYSH